MLLKSLLQLQLLVNLRKSNQATEEYEKLIIIIKMVNINQINKENVAHKTEKI